MSSGSVLAGRYRLTGPLSEGGVGEVWSATHLLTGRDVAIKRLIASRHGNAPSEARARFVLEAQSACAVEHPNVVEVFDFVEPDDEAPFLVMELLQGETLARKLTREGALDPEETARLLLPVVSAVGTAHARGIVHRDLKPSNIFLRTGHGPRPHVKVLDFGIAKWISTTQGEQSVRTQTGSTLGTPSYMSPEQATAERGVDHRADIWSIGVILYECLSGARPVEGENAAQMVMRLLSSGIIPIEHLVPGLPPQLGELIGRMLARDPQKRPEDLLEVFAVLGSLARESAPSFGKPSAVPARDGEEASQRSEPWPAPNLPSPEASPETTWAPATLTPSDQRGGRSRPRAARPRRSSWFHAALVLGALLVFTTLALRWARAPTSGARPAPPSAAPQIDPSPPPAVVEVAPAPIEASRAAISEEIANSEQHAVNPASSGKPQVRAARREPPNRKLELKSAPPAPATRTSGGAAAPVGRPRGAECDRSSDCASRLCLALVCE